MLDVKVLLEGAYNGGSGVMNTLLNDGGLLPLAQPYNVGPWNYAGTESLSVMPSDVIDWVLVELRDASSSSDAYLATNVTGWPKALLLKSNGSVVDLDGSSLPTISTPIVNNLYVVVRHRNHIAVMSANGATLAGDVYSYDFTGGLPQSYEGAGSSKMVGSRAVMVTGDIDHDGKIFVSDYSKWATDFGATNGYYNSDLDLDRKVFVSDYNKWVSNFGSKTSDCLFTDPRDNHVYKCIFIGTQTWMAENLAFLPSVSPSAAGSDTAAYYYVYGFQGSNVDAAKAAANYSSYGVLYNWEASKVACPPGWHLPRDEEWMVLEKNLGMSNSEADSSGWRNSGIVGGRLKKAGTSNWRSPNSGATNSSGYSAIPGGYRMESGLLSGLGDVAGFWSVSLDDESRPWHRQLSYLHEGVARINDANRSSGFSARCLFGPTPAVPPKVVTFEMSAISKTSASSGGNVTNDGGADITDRGICWSTSVNPSIADNKTSDGTGTGLFTSNLTGLTSNTTYYVRAFATNNTGTSYGSQFSFVTDMAYQDLFLGLFVHYTYFDINRNCGCSTLSADLSEVKSLDELADNLDINDLVATAASMRAQYLIFTTFHSNMNVLYPSPVMKQNLPGHCSERDVIAELITALKEKNIRLILYFHPSDGHDLIGPEQNLLGWNDGPPYTRWNNFTNELLAELVNRYGNDVLGYFIDGGLPKQVDAVRLRKTIKDRTPNAWIIQNGNGNYNPLCADYGINEEDLQSPYTARSFPRCPRISGQWWASGSAINLSPELAYLNTILQATVINRIGGGIAWSFSPYPGAIWETGVPEFCRDLASYADKAGKSLFGTRPSRSYITADRQYLIGTKYAATESPDGKVTYLHVFLPPGGQRLELPAPTDNRIFKSAYLLSNKNKVDLQQTGSAVFLTLDSADIWDDLDTIIVLE